MTRSGGNAKRRCLCHVDFWAAQHVSGRERVAEDFNEFSARVLIHGAHRHWSGQEAFCHNPFRKDDFMFAQKQMDIGHATTGGWPDGAIIYQCFRGEKTVS